MSALIVVSGPSGVGKGTILQKVLKRLPNLEIGLSWTTRAPRPGDEEGIKRYHYVTRNEFMAAVSRGEFLEWAEYGGNLYGSWYGGDKHTLLEIEVQGALQVAEARPEAILAGLLPPGDDLVQQMTVIKQRLLGRGSDNSEAARKRLAIAPEEITTITAKWPHIIVNADVEWASQKLVELIEPHLC